MEFSHDWYRARLVELDGIYREELGRPLIETGDIEGISLRMFQLREHGFTRDDLVAYGKDVTTRPPFIDALEIFQVARGETREIAFDHGPGTYFVACMPDTNSMIVLDDMVVEGA